MKQAEKKNIKDLSGLQPLAKGILGVCEGTVGSKQKFDFVIHKHSRSLKGKE